MARRDFKSNFGQSAWQRAICFLGIKKKVFDFRFKGNRDLGTNMAQWLVPHNAYFWQQ
jgi:hypothetical protein